MHKHIENNGEFKALRVNKGTNSTSTTSKNKSDLIDKIKSNKQKKFDINYYLNAIKNSDKTILSRAITYVESSLIQHHVYAQLLVEKCIPLAGKSIRIGITGVPGAGKSTFIEAFGKYLTSKGHKVCVLAVDPSSSLSKGSILGDKTRMEELSIDSNAFIRPSPSAGTLGGVAQKTRETIFLCEAAGYDVILIETVGVGQSETMVHSMTDFFLLLMLTGAGDQLQGIKRGIMEMADMILINKADGTNLKKAEIAKNEYTSAINFLPKKENGWKVSVECVSALEKTGIDLVWDNIIEYKNFSIANNSFFKNRENQSMYWLHETIMEELKNSFYQNPIIKNEIEHVQNQILRKELTSFAGAKTLLKIYKDSKGIF